MNKSFSPDIKNCFKAFLLVLIVLPAVSAATSRMPISIGVSIISVNKQLADRWEINEPKVGGTVTVPAADLIYALADMDSAEMKSQTKLVVYNAQKGEVDKRRELCYLAEEGDGSYSKRSTGKAVGAVMKAMAVIGEEGKVTVDLDYQLTTALPAEDVDPNTSMRIGKPLLTSQAIKTRVTLEPGRSAIVGQLDKVNSREFVILHAEVMSSGRYRPILPDSRGALEQIFALWEKREKELAVKKFFMVDWTKDGLASADSVLNISESQFYLLPSKERYYLSREAVETSKMFRKIAYAARTEAVRSKASHDFEKAELQFESVLEAGKYLKRSGTISTLRGAGEMVMEGALEELVELYEQTNQEDKLKEAEKMLEEIQ